MSLRRPTLMNEELGGARCVLKITCDITEPLTMETTNEPDSMPVV